MKTYRVVVRKVYAYAVDVKASDHHGAIAQAIDSIGEFTTPDDIYWDESDYELLTDDETDSSTEAK